MRVEKQSLTAVQWLDWLRDLEGRATRAGWYGRDDGVLEQREAAWKHFLGGLLGAVHRVGSPKEIPWTLVRAPGRVNLMGVHIDHRGGTVNYQAFDREIFMAVHPRTDGLIRGWNAEAVFEPFEFSIARRLPTPGAQPWKTFLERTSVKPGHWSNYVAAAVLRLQDLHPNQRFGGMDIFVGGDIPSGAGVSSSSALVVASLLATCAVEGLSVEENELAERAGEAEWYVGTRGGMGDHASILFSRQGRVASIGFFPLTRAYGSIPENARVVLAHSGISAQKAENAREAFNQRVAAYELGMVWLRERHPELRDRLKQIRDISPQGLGIGLPEIYSAIAELPIRSTADEMEEKITDLRSELGAVWDFYGRLDSAYPIREVVLFGAAECARGRAFAERLDRGALDEAGRLMAISHDGDRVVRFAPGRPETPSALHRSPRGSEDLQMLAEAAAAGDSNAALEWQPGGYRCSTPEMDRMVDLLSPLEGVYGAGLTGAGLGGCIVTLCDAEAVQTVLRTLHDKYYTPAQRPEQVFVCASIQGACVV